MAVNPFSIFISKYKKLNPEQKKAVDTVEGPVMVIAGPGTGKTQILTLRIANILRITDTPPDAILALTFTESASATLRRRLVEIVGAQGYRVCIYTFHGFANEVIRRFPDAFPRIIGSRNITDVERVALLQELVDTSPISLLRPYGNAYFYVPMISQKLSEIKRENISTDKYERMLCEKKDAFLGIQDLTHQSGKYKGAMKGKYASRARKLDRDEELSLLYRAYETALAARHWFDYEDMLLEVIRALETQEELRLTLQEESQYLLADEHQDANESQNKLLELLTSFHDQPNLFVVGDEKQAIFKFQGASLDNFLFFKRRFPYAEVITLRENYRSTQPILDAAHSLMQAAPVHPDVPRVPLLAASAKGVARVRIAALAHPQEEVMFMAHEVKRLIEQGVKPREIAVLYRVNKDVEPLAAALTTLSVPYGIESSQNVLHERSVRGFMALLDAVNRYGQDEALVGVLHVRFLGVPALTATMFLSRIRKSEAGMYSALSDRPLLEKVGIKRPEALLRFGKKMERWHSLSHNEDLQTFLEIIAGECGLVADLLARPDPEVALGGMRALFLQARDLSVANRFATLADFMQHLALLERYSLSVSAPRTELAKEGVRLMTAHRAKGLEFEHVYVVGATDGHWGNRTQREFFSPLLSTHGDEQDSDIDDERRLFYVALTRAKQSVTITYARMSESGSPSLPTQFIEEISPELKEDVIPEKVILPLFPSHRTFGARIDSTQLRELFLHQGLSVTALNNYLTCPWRYFYRNLLRIPEAPQKELEYGTAIHAALRNFFEVWKTSETPGVDALLMGFTRALSKSSLSSAMYSEAESKGHIALTAYYEQHHESWSRSLINEYRVSVMIPTEVEGLAHVRLRGDIDKITFEDGGVVLHDYKTGKRKTRGEIEGGKARDIKDASTWGDYKRQLVFYKLLLELQEKPMQVLSGRLEFIEPIENGSVIVEDFLLDAIEASALTSLIHKTSADIWALGFTSKQCGDKECRYCQLREFLLPTLRMKKTK